MDVDGFIAHSGAAHTIDFQHRLPVLLKANRPFSIRRWPAFQASGTGVSRDHLAVIDDDGAAARPRSRHLHRAKSENGGRSLPGSTGRSGRGCAAWRSRPTPMVGSSRKIIDGL